MAVPQRLWLCVRRWICMTHHAKRLGWHLSSPLGWCRSELVEHVAKETGYGDRLIKHVSAVHPFQPQLRTLGYPVNVIGRPSVSWCGTSPLSPRVPGTCTADAPSSQSCRPSLALLLGPLSFLHPCQAIL
eukprot:scaffold1639_cov331-Pavlova_lutheri.AAC.26